jgi:hypothetical protein
MTFTKAYVLLKKHLVTQRRSGGLFGRIRDPELEEALEAALLTMQKLSTFGPPNERIVDDVDDNKIPIIGPKPAQGKRVA